MTSNACLFMERDFLQLEGQEHCDRNASTLYRG